MNKVVVGSDIDERLVRYSKQNCEWLQEQFKTTNNWTAFERDARFITKDIFKKHANVDQVDAIITEGYLGKPFSQPPTNEEMEVEFRELANLHLNWLKAAKTVLKKNGKIVMCLTAYQKDHHITHFPRFKEIVKTAGYAIERSFTYKRPDQIVIRDIFILK